MKRGQPLGLDELMIVNPGPAGSDVVFLGEDGYLYGVQALAQAPGFGEVGPFFLGDDGALYQVEGLGGSDVSGEGFFLGEDGFLYRLVR